MFMVVFTNLSYFLGLARASSPRWQVKIVGHSAESVQAARAAVEYIKEFYPVEESMVGWMLGKQRKNLVPAGGSAFRPRGGHSRRGGICCDLAPPWGTW